MESPVEQYYLRLPELQRHTFLYLRDYILSLNKEVNTAFKYKLPFIMYKGKWVCYFNHNKSGTYIGFTQADKMPSFPYLQAEGRSFIKVYYLDCESDLKIKEIDRLLQESFKAIDKSLLKTKKTNK